MVAMQLIAYPAVEFFIIYVNILAQLTLMFSGQMTVGNKF